MLFHLAAAGADTPALAATLADAKALAGSRENPTAIVIGADQILDLDGERFAKPASTAEARDQLSRLAGRSHALHTAVAAATDGAIVWRHSDTARLTMRRLSEAAINAYLARVGPAALTSAGAYQIEGEGIQLFDTIAGDYFAILGLPMLPVLAFLRNAGALE